jgi:hypothetical protein
VQQSSSLTQRLPAQGQLGQGAAKSPAKSVANSARKTIDIVLNHWQRRVVTEADRNSDNKIQAALQPRFFARIHKVWKDSQSSQKFTKFTKFLEFPKRAFDTLLPKCKNEARISPRFKRAISS